MQATVVACRSTPAPLLHDSPSPRFRSDSPERSQGRPDPIGRGWGESSEMDASCRQVDNPSKFQCDAVEQVSWSIDGLATTGDGSIERRTKRCTETARSSDGLGGSVARAVAGGDATDAGRQHEGRDRREATGCQNGLLRPETKTNGTVTVDCRWRYPVTRIHWATGRQPWLTDQNTQTDDRLTEWTTEWRITERNNTLIDGRVYWIWISATNDDDDDDDDLGGPDTIERQPEVNEFERRVYIDTSQWRTRHVDNRDGVYSLGHFVTELTIRPASGRLLLFDRLARPRLAARWPPIGCMYRRCVRGPRCANLPASQVPAALDRASSRNEVLPPGGGAVACIWYAQR